MVSKEKHKNLNVDNVEKNTKKANKLKGSAILLVILTMVAITVYSTGTYIEQEHLQILQKKYEDGIIKKYEENTKNIDETYENIEYLYNK